MTDAAAQKAAARVMVAVREARARAATERVKTAASAAVRRATAELGAPFTLAAAIETLNVLLPPEPAGPNRIIARPPVDPLPTSFDVREVFEGMAESALAAGADGNSLKTLLARIKELP